ncbi:MAG: coenzyme F430 synthase [Methanophagales archaeon ANME-1-THS]|nr:MAG: coenzyme F430 synthase [Methanophagales archaeon ANME-1-THS]
MTINEASTILVLDPIHGAEVIAEALKELGKEVEIFNPYRESTYTPRMCHDLIISPIHLNPNFEVVKHALTKGIPFMTHHEAVKEIALIKNLFEGIKVIEVTGTIGKTSTCELISQLVRDRPVLLHTSSSTRFVSPTDTQIYPRLGGTPANVLTVMALTRDRNLKPAVAVFEVSLGLTGVGDVGVITSIKEDYRIAGGTKDAAAVKKASIRNLGANSVIVHPGLELPDVHGAANSFGGSDKNLWIEGEANISPYRACGVVGQGPTVIYNRLSTITGDLISGELAFKPFDSYMGTEFYRTPLEAAFCAVLSLGIAPEEINTHVSPVAGRMKLEKLKGRFLIDNSNSGTKLKFLGEITEMARRLADSGKMILIIGEESQYVCEGVNVEELKKVVEQRASEFHEIILVGEDFKQKIKGKNVVFSPHLNAALDKAIEDSEEGFVIISYVKTWR